MQHAARVREQYGGEAEYTHDFNLGNIRLGLAAHTGPLNWLCSEKGRYLLLPMDEAPELTEEQEDGLEAALASVRAGKDMSLEEVREAQTPRRAMPLVVAPEALANLGRESTARVDSVNR